jgi:uncharacterized protein
VNSEPKIEDLLATIRKAIDDDLGDLGAGGIGSSMSSESRGTLMRGAMREMRVSVGPDTSRNSTSDEIALLRQRVNKNRVAEAFAQPQAPKLSPMPKPVLTPQTQPRTGFAGILGGDTPLPRPSARPAVAIPREPEPPQFRPALHDEPRYDYGMAEPSDDLRWQNEAQQDYQPAQYPPAAYGHDPYVPEPYVEETYAERGYAPMPALVSSDTAASAGASFSQLAETIMARALGERSVEDMTRELLRGMLKQWLDDNLPSLVERLVREEIERVARRGR